MKKKGRGILARDDAEPTDRIAAEASVCGTCATDYLVFLNFAFEMFSKAKRFELATIKANIKDASKPVSTVKSKPVKSAVITVKLPKPPLSVASDQQSECGSIRSTKSAFVTPKPATPCIPVRSHSCCKKRFTPALATVTPKSLKKPSSKESTKTDVVTSQQVEIRNKDYTIAEYSQQIEDLKNEIAVLQNQIKENAQTEKKVCLEEIEQLNNEIEKVSLEDEKRMNSIVSSVNYEQTIIGLQAEIQNLCGSLATLEEELLDKQIELSATESVIAIRDSLCQDLQDKLTDKENALDEVRQRLEMVNGHHALALKANESIRREYKVELETLKSKMDEEKQAVLVTAKTDQEALKVKYTEQMEELKRKIEFEKREPVAEMERLIKKKEEEMKARIEQVEESAEEKLRLCEIQYEQRSRGVHDHWHQQQEQLKLLELEVAQLKYSLSASNDQKLSLQTELSNLRNERDTSLREKSTLLSKIDQLEDLMKKKSMEYENERNKLTCEVDRVTKEKHKYETSLNVTRDIVQVLSTRLRDSDNELDGLEVKLQEMAESKRELEIELATYQSTLNNTLLECNEYKEALVNILKSKAALAKEHTRMMEHNVTLIGCLETVEKEAYREFGSVKDELVDNVEMYKREAAEQIQKLRDEIEKKRALVVLATEHAGQAQAAADQSHLLLQRAAHDLERLETDNQRLQQQIQDQQSLAVEVSLLRQENEELTMSVATQASVIDKLKKEHEHQLKKEHEKSPSLHRKAYKAGKENAPIMLSPLRERNY